MSPAGTMLYLVLQNDQVLVFSVEEQSNLAVIEDSGAEGISELRSVIRGALLTAPGVAILRVPLEEAELVRRAVAMPHQLARRFEDGTVELALRADSRFLVEAGLDGYRVDAWRSGGGDGGG